MRKSRKTEFILILTATVCLYFGHKLHNCEEFHGISEGDVVEDDQEGIFRRTRIWRYLENINYAGFCGPWFEEYFMQFYLENLKSVVSQRLFLTISWTNCHLRCNAKQKEMLQLFINSLDRRKKYFSVVQIARGLQHEKLGLTIPEDLDLLLFSAGGFTIGKKVRNVAIPLLKSTLQMRGYAKKHKASFVGSLSTSPIRDELYRRYNGSFIFTSGSDWQQIMEQSYFSLCPRGFGATSFRLYEAIQLHSIPIYVWESELLLPFEDEIEWGRIGLIVHRSEIDQIPSRMAKIDLNSTLTEISRVQKYFTMEYTSTYILKILQKER